MTLKEFVDKYIGKKIDFDGAYGAQCVDLFRQYCKDVLRAGTQLKPVEGAKDFFLKFDEVSRDAPYFQKIETKEPKYGDVVVFGATSTNKYGHVAICISFEKAENVIVCFEQNGFSQKGAEIVLRKNDNLLGVLRFKGPEVK